MKLMAYFLYEYNMQKVLNRILAMQISRYTTITIQHDQIELIWVMQGAFTIKKHFIV